MLGANLGLVLYGEISMMVLGAKRLGCGVETTKCENRGETTCGGGGEWFGAKHLDTLYNLSTDTAYTLASIFGRICASVL